MKKIWTLIFFTAWFFIILPSAAFSEPYDEEGSYIEDSDDGDGAVYQSEEENAIPSGEDFYPEEQQKTVRRDPDPLPDYYDGSPYASSFYSRLPQSITSGEKVIIVNPRLHTWGAYTKEGHLVRAGLATSGSTWCSDLGRSCRTKVGTFRINSLGNQSCISSRYPLGKGGAPMPYCMYFNGNQGIHGSYAVSEGNHSHGCVRVSVADAEWIRFHFATMGTKVIVMRY